MRDGIGPPAGGAAPVKNRMVDIALLVGLVLVAGAIVWTLFSLGRDPAPAGPDRTAPQTENGAPANGDGGRVVPVAPGGEDAAENGDAAGAGDGAEASGAGAGDGNDDGEGEGAAADAGDDDGNDDGGVGAAAEDRPNPDVPADEAPPLPDEGPVELGRIGFSYVTGGAGACGIVLEAWTHVAVSRELLEAYGCGAEVTVTLDDETADRTEFDAVIGDTMNPVRSRTVNVYVGEDEPALEFGLTSGTLIPER